MKTIADLKIGETMVSAGFGEMSKAKAETYLRNLLTEGTQGFHKDNSWAPINKMFERLHKADIPIQNMKSQYYNNKGSSSMNDGKQWTFEVPFVKGGWYVTVIAANAGSVADPSETYDIVVTVSYSAQVKAD